jgi:hypothetical protein
MAYVRGTAAEYFCTCANGEDSFFNCVGNFLDDFYSGSDEERMHMVVSPITDEITEENRRYAAFFTAMVESLCLQYEVERPKWIWEEIYKLPEPWFLYDGWKLRAWQLVQTPPAFKSRNILGGDNMLSRV